MKLSDLETLGQVVSGETTDEHGRLITREPLVRMRFDYYVPAGAPDQELRYQGEAAQGTVDSDADWTIKRYTWAQFGSKWRVTDIQILEGAWSDRATLNWT